RQDQLRIRQPSRLYPARKARESLQVQAGKLPVVQPSGLDSHQEGSEDHQRGLSVGDNYDKSQKSRRYERAWDLFTNRQENCGSPNHPGSAPARLARGGGEGGIRTHGPLRDNGFRDRPNRPLSHLSAPSVQVKKLEVQKFEEKGRTSGTFHFQSFKLSDLQLVSSRSPRQNPCISSWLSCSNNPPTTSTR